MLWALTKQFLRRAALPVAGPDPCLVQGWGTSEMQEPELTETLVAYAHNAEAQCSLRSEPQNFPHGL